MRCVALAEELRDRGIDCAFIADFAGVPWAAAQVTSRGFGLRQHAEGSPGLVEKIMDLAPDAVVLDSYHAPPSVSSALRTAGTPLLTIVDGAARGQSGDLYVDQNLDSENQPGPTDAPRLAGLPYALLRGEVLRLRPDAPPTGTRQDPPKVLAYFGGTDAYGASPVLAAALVASGAAFDATIVAPRPELRAAIESLPLRPGQRMSAIGPTEELMTIAVGSDVVISASGTSLWELLCIGAATAIIWVVDNQELGYERVLAADLAAGLGHLDDVRDNPAGAAETLARLLGDVAWRDRLRSTGWALVDGQGRARVASALIEMIKPR
ncbi:MAG TPA: spore coat protein [Micromonosporaceae bacterium]|jgi:spore coat polysaccharide biosynthesis predicted glycosyltransferase SpsG